MNPTKQRIVLLALAGLVVLSFAPLAVGQQILASWPGMTNLNNSAPPDSHGAAGPGGILQTVNTSVQYWTKTGGTNWGPVNFTAFWASAGNSGQGNADAKVIFDHGSGRFYVVIQENIRTNRTSFLNLAVSRSSHPVSASTNDWFFYRIEMTDTRNGKNYGGDYPGFGSDGQAVYVTFNMFELRTNGFAGTPVNSQIFAFKKAEIDRGVLLFNHVFTPDVITGGTLVPASGIAGGGAGNRAYFVQVSLPVFIALWVLEDPLGTPNLLLPFQLPVPPNGDLPGAGAPQAGTTNRLDTLGEELKAQGNALWREGKIWFCYTGGVPFTSRTRVYYYQIDTHDFPSGIPTVVVPNLFDPGYIDLGPEGGQQVWTFQPALGGNAAGDLCMVYTKSASNIFPTIMCALRPHCATSFLTPFPVRVSPSFYFGFARTNEPMRWGDYASVTLDPSDGTFWVTHEYARSSTFNDWGTWWAKISITPSGGNDLFVDNSLTCFFTTGQSNCTPLTLSGPFKQVQNGVNAAICGDSVNIRVGSYNEQFAITKAIQLRAYGGTVTIGRP